MPEEYVRALPELEEATEAFLAALRNQLTVDFPALPGASPSPPRGVREWVNKFLKAHRFLNHWRDHIFSVAPPSVQAVILSIDVVFAIIEALNPPGPE